MHNEFDKSQLKEFYRSGLLDDVVPFWLKYGVDHEHGGLISSLTQSGEVADSDKSVWIQGRFAWLLGELYNHPLCQDNPNRSLWLETAEKTLSFVKKYAFDDTDGRMWFHLTRDGQPIRKRRYAYSESFAAIAFGELALATQKQEYADLAEQCFNQFVSHSLDPQGVEPKFTDVRPCKSIGFPMITINTASELRQSIGLESADQWIDDSIRSIQNDFMKPDIECVMETVTTDGKISNHFDGRTLNPGHAIEGAWFIMAEGKKRANQNMIDTGLLMLDWMWNRGWDKEHGGLLYFTSVNELPVQEYWHDMKFWWPHNEAVIATLLAFELTGNEKYLQWHQQVHQWAHKHFADPEHGEWYGYLHRDGRISSPLKGNLWKGPFHLPRMQLQCWEILNRM
ncbi:MAG: AGE family epimerase/isomerase [Mariniblastus sp.]|nr:AGE family epimerase/isomerase [Mariniblastus sp.]